MALAATIGEGWHARRPAASIGTYKQTGPADGQGPYSMVLTGAADSVLTEVWGRRDVRDWQQG